MLIPVIYPNGSHDLVKDFYLDYLIEEKKIDQFKRSDGWVSIFSDSIRSKKSRAKYTGPERRQALITEDEEKIDIEFFKPGNS